VPRRLHPPRLEALENRSLLSSFHVTNANDSGPGSLRQAMLDANAQAGQGRNIIDFTPRVNGPITLLNALPAIDNDVTLRAPGSNAATVQRSTASGTPEFRIFTISPGRTVDITGLTIANGHVTGDIGGGILNQGTLVLTNSVVTGNTSLFANGQGGRGGGIQNTGTLTVEASQVTGNAATINGGGIANGFAQTAATLTVEGSQITGNNARVGAGLENARGTATLDGTLVGSNTGLGDGAGIRSERGTTLTLVDSAISGNTSGAGGTGGLASGANLTLVNTTISDNASAAAGMYVFGVGDVLISRSTISNNVTNNTFGFAVGGIWSRSFGELRIEDSTISGNVGGFAGGVFNEFGSGGLEIVRSTISGNTAVPFGSFSAGGVFGPAKIDNSTISGNTVVADNIYLGSLGAGTAGGVFTLPGYPTTIDHSTIAFNRVLNAPGGDVHSSGGVNGFNTSFTYNGNTYTYDANVEVRNTIIARNESNVGDPDVTGSFQSQGHNLIGVLTAGATGFVASDLSGTVDTPLDPLLAPLADNGGPTFTHALYRGSPAHNAGDNSNAPPTDQRGRNRIVAGVIDIGSFEATNLPPPPSGALAQVRAATTHASPSLTTSLNDPGPPVVATPGRIPLPKRARGAFTERFLIPRRGPAARSALTSLASPGHRLASGARYAIPINADLIDAVFLDMARLDQGSP
jgi:hypothetical protein